MEEKRECDGHCERCGVIQRVYCAAQMAYYNQKEIAEIKAILSGMNKQDIQTNVGANKVSENEEEQALRG